MFNLIKKEIKLYYFNNNLWHICRSSYFYNKYTLVSSNYVFKKDYAICIRCKRRFPSFLFINIKNNIFGLDYLNYFLRRTNVKELTIQVYRPFFRWLLGKWV